MPAKLEEKPKKIYDRPLKSGELELICKQHYSGMTTGEIAEVMELREPVVIASIENCKVLGLYDDYVGGRQ